MFSSKLRRAHSPRRVLAITYYVEPRDLRMITIPVARVNLLLVLGTLICAWSLGSVVYLGMQVVTSLGGDGKEALASVADGSRDAPRPRAAISEEPITPQAEEEAPYDYDKLMPPEVVKAAPQTVSPEVEKLIAQKTGTEVTAKPAKESVAPQTVEPSVTLAAEEKKPSTLALLEPTLVQKAQAVDLRFKLKNLSNVRAYGNVWGVATYADGDGEVRKVASHAGIDVETPTDLENAADTTTFGARRLTSKTLKFDPPAAGEVIRGVTVYAYDEASKTLLEEEIDIR